MKVIVEYNRETGEIKDTYNGNYLANIGASLDIEKYTDTRKLKEYVAMAKDLKDSGFTSDEIIELIGKGY